MISQDKLSQLHQNLITFKQRKFDQYNWQHNARPEQLIPDSDWHTWCVIAGRGFGKTRTGAEAVRQMVEQGYRRIGFIGASINDIRNIMIEGHSGLMSTYPESSRPEYYPSINLIKWPNGARGYTISADNPENIRGYQFDLVWLDEFAKFHNPEGCWHQVCMSLRLGDKPRSIITTTPKPLEILKNLISQPTTHCTTGSTYDNKHLSEQFLANLNNTYSNTSFARQEIYGDILHGYTLWSPNDIRYSTAPSAFNEIVIAIDPAVTANHNSDETGIIVIGLHDGKVYIIEDASIHASPKVWMQKVIDLYNQYAADKIIIEVNQGGDLFKDMFHAAGITQLIEVRATQNKFRRAQQAFMFYEKGLVYHVKKMPKLESQMLAMSEHSNCAKSPDRLDALVWGVISCIQCSGQGIITMW